MTANSPGVVTYPREVPAESLEGDVTVKVAELEPVPTAVVTLKGPVVEPVGTAVEICVSETTLNDAAVPLKAAAVAPVKPEPPRVTAVPMGPLVGLKDVIWGGDATWATVNTDPLVPVPAELVTLKGPVVAPLGTKVLRDVSDKTLKFAAVPLNRTAEAPVNPDPATVTAAPLEPLVGVNEEIAGTDTICVTVKEEVEVAVPQLVQTVTGPVAALTGTTALI